MSAFQFNRGEKTHLLGQALRALIPMRLDTLPVRGDNAPKRMPDKLNFVAAAHALDVVNALEYQIGKDREYREKRESDRGDDHPRAGVPRDEQPFHGPVDDTPF